MRTPLIAANWKMHKTIDEAIELIDGLLDQLDDDSFDGREILLCPPATALLVAAEQLDGTGIALGGQNMAAAREGAFTGEISPLMLLDVGCDFVILGHSERRHVFGEEDALINKKVKLALECGLIPVFAVGEKLEQRKAGAAESTVIDQLATGLDGVSANEMADVVIAYEPVWAIGTGETASPQDAPAMHAAIRGWLAAQYGESVAEDVRILYGGSVKPNNVDELMAEPDIDGALVGGASLDAESFARIINFA